MDTQKGKLPGGEYLTIQELKQRYTSIEKIKRGGQKVVYKAITSEGIIVALKIISNVSDLRVLQEIEIVRQLSLSNIPRIQETGIVLDEIVGEEALYIIEEFIEGISLRDWLSSGN